LDQIDQLDIAARRSHSLWAAKLNEFGKVKPPGQTGFHCLLTLALVQVLALESQQVLVSV
jgi:hypothetical protein